MRHVSQASGAAPVRPTAVSSLSRQLAALMRLHVLAHRENNLELLLQEACRSAAKGVDAGFAGALQYRADEQTFVLQAGIGMQASLVGRARITADLSTTAGLAWHTDQPIHFRHLAAGGRIRMLDAATRHGIERLVSVPVHGQGETVFGVLEVGSAEAGRFARCDLVFLQAVADCIGAAVAWSAARGRRADWAKLVAERRRDMREPKLEGVWRPDVRTEPGKQRRDQGDSERTGRSTQNARKRRQAPTFSGLQQDTQIQHGSG